MDLSYARIRLEGLAVSFLAVVVGIVSDWLCGRKMEWWDC